jgi:glycerol-3-phosphate dehydrogenase
VRDAFTHGEAHVSATWVINAAGPWVDRVCARSGVDSSVPLVGGIRGSHLLLSKVRDMPRSAVYAEAVDGRPIFIVPWNSQLLVGTTEVRDHSDPADAEPSPEEVSYLLTSAQRLLPQSGIGWEHVRSTFAGIRPLPFSDQRPSSISRKHFLHDHADDGAGGMISVVGGKLTTASALGRECARKIGVHVPEPPAVVMATCACDGMESTLKEWAVAVAARSGTSAQSARAIAEWHGRRALTIAAMAGAKDALRMPICDHTSHLTAEAVAAVQSEYAVTLADILLRRVPVALGPCWSRECSRLAATRIGSALNWNNHHTAEQLELFEQERAAFLRKPDMIRTESQPRAA